MERKASHLLHAMEDPRERHACMRSLHAFGADVLVLNFLLQSRLLWRCHITTLECAVAL